MSKPKEYRLVTVADIVDVLTPENIDNFLIDFKSFVESIQNLCDLARMIDPELKDKKYSELGEAVFNWIDDGKHDNAGGLRIENPETGKFIDLPLNVDAMNAFANKLKDKKNLSYDTLHYNYPMRDRRNNLDESAITSCCNVGAVCYCACCVSDMGFKG